MGGGELMCVLGKQTTMISNGMSNNIKSVSNICDVLFMDDNTSVNIIGGG